MVMVTKLDVIVQVEVFVTTRMVPVDVLQDFTVLNVNTNPSLSNLF